MAAKVQAAAGVAMASGSESMESRLRAGEFLHARPVQCAWAILALMVAALPALITALAVRIVLGRPLMFRQIRSGLGGREIVLSKFRTMHDLRDREGRLLPDSERHTRFTRFVRAVRLDEFPQLFSILKGDMDFIGPRPLQPATIASFGAAGVIRGAVRPGLTGWAQVNGNTRLTDWEKIALDIWYIDHRSALLDLRIVLLTAATVLTGERVNRRNLDVALSHLQSRNGSDLGLSRGAP
jgi:lipopolysaccharide/colanic/teichoic acid biosynthesis glycosyltransferase